MAEKQSSGAAGATKTTKAPSKTSTRTTSKTAATAAKKATAKAGTASSTAKSTETPRTAKSKAASTAKSTAKPAAKTASTTAKAPAPKADAKKPAAKKAAGAKKAESAKKAEPAKKTEPAKPEPPAAPKPVAKKAPPFVVGDKVVYPHHGAATITAVQQVEFKGEKRPYYVLEVATDQLVVSVPVDGALELGVRPVISTNVARKVFATFREEPQEAGANWSRWYKLLTEKINSGDIFQVAEVVRDLTYAQQVKGISPALKRMLAKARLIIVSELRFALKLDEEEAVRRLDRALPKVDEPVEL